MIAELHGKISSTGSNLSDRLEDELTGNVFGSLRYIPFDLGLKPMLSVAHNMPSLRDSLAKINTEYLADCIEFWPYDKEGELDVLINLPNCVIGIEVKLYSGLSSDDEIDNSEKDEISFANSINQLSRESRIVKKRSGDKNSFLIFIAPDSICSYYYQNVVERKLVVSGVEFGYLSWQDILYALSGIEAYGYSKVVIDDLISLLKRKSFERFNGFDNTLQNVDPNSVYVYSNRFYDYFENTKTISEETYYEYR